MNTPTVQNPMGPETAQDYRVLSVKEVTKEYLEAMGALGATPSPTSIQVEINARAGEFQKMIDATQRNSTREIGFTPKGSEYDKITTNEKGEKIMPPSMLLGLQKKIKAAFDAKAVKVDSPESDNNTLVYVPLRQGDFDCFVTLNKEQRTLKAALRSYVEELNASGTVEISFLFHNTEKSLSIICDKGRITMIDLPPVVAR